MAQMARYRETFNAYDAVIGVALFKRFGLGAVLGYLVAGIAIGPSGLKLVGDVESVMRASELGVVLLFVIGLGLQPTRLWAMRGTATPPPKTGRADPWAFFSMSVERLIAKNLRIAREDLACARMLATVGNRNAAYLCEQAAEKIIRAGVLPVAGGSGLAAEEDPHGAGRTRAALRSRPRRLVRARGQVIEARLPALR